MAGIGMRQVGPSFAELGELIRGGEIALIDTRPPAAFCRGHPSGSISVVYSARSFGERVAVAAPGERPVLLLSSDLGEAAGATHQLNAFGRECHGTLPDDPSAWARYGIPRETLREAAVTEVGDAPEAADRVVLDVREPVEWETGYVPGAWLISLGNLAVNLDDLPRDHEIVVICEAGVRSATAASTLRAAGFRHVAHVPEGTAGYRKTGRPLAFPDE